MSTDFPCAANADDNPLSVLLPTGIEANMDDNNPLILIFFLSLFNFEKKKQS